MTSRKIPGEMAICLVSIKERPFSRTDQQRIADLKTKLRDEEYMNGAILRIATVLSDRLTLG
jgi:hypothetical protein